MLPGQFPSQPPPLVGHSRGPQETHLPQTTGLPHPSGLIPRQASPRPGGGDDGGHGYRREYLEGAGVLYGTLALAGCQEVGKRMYKIYDNFAYFVDVAIQENKM